MVNVCARRTGCIHLDRNPAESLSLSALISRPRGRGRGNTKNKFKKIQHVSSCNANSCFNRLSAAASAVVYFAIVLYILYCAYWLIRFYNESFESEKPGVLWNSLLISNIRVTRVRVSANWSIRFGITHYYCAIYYNIVTLCLYNMVFGWRVVCCTLRRAKASRIFRESPRGGRRKRFANIGRNIYSGVSIAVTENE